MAAVSSRRSHRPKRESPRGVTPSKPILEINAKHPVVTRLKDEVRHFDDWANVLFDQAVLAEGGQLDDPATFVKRINQLMLEMRGGESPIVDPAER